jgi:hypothetical protein
MLVRGGARLPLGEGTARRVGEGAEAGGLSVDELMRQGSRSPWLTCCTRWARIKAENMSKHVAKVHPRR